MILVARYYVRVDAATLADLKTIKRRLGGSRSGLTEKNRATLRQFDDDHARALLYTLPVDVLTEVARKDDGGRRWAVKVQVALAVEFLLNLPIRMENLIALEIGTHLIRPSGGKDSLILTLEPGETKTDEPIEFLVPPDLTRFIGRYVEKFRPRLESADSAYLFPGQGGGHKHPSTLSHQMVTLIKKRTGLRVTPHQFRHLAAKISLDAEPGNYFGVATLLGHKSLKTTMAFYSGLRTRAAGKHFASILDRDRQAVSENAGNRRRRSKR